MRKIKLFLVALFAIIPFLSQGQNVNKVAMPPKMTQNRLEIQIPDVAGYKVVKCDFHIHTVFSDGLVWPTWRVTEAWEDGLDAISITDHIEYRPFKEYFNSNLNTSYEVAKGEADRLGLILIRGTEITREQGPLGHYNALFIKDADIIHNDDPEKAIANAAAQGAFILFNHPGWKMDTLIVSPFQQRLLDKGLIHGIEIFNHREFYPRAISWCADFGLTKFANSDIHGVISEEYDPIGAAEPYTNHRPMTLVLATEKSQDAIKEALFAKRTIACFNSNFAGSEEHLMALYNACVSTKQISENDNNYVWSFVNNSSLRFNIKVNKGGIQTIEPFSSILVNISKKKSPTITITNMWYREDKHPSFVFSK